MTERASASTRRAFLTGQPLRDAIAAAQERAAELALEAAASATGRASWLLEFSRRAMACEFQILLNAGQASAAADAALEALELVARLEDQMTVYRAHSEISRINRLAATAPQPVESRLFDLLVTAVELHQQTCGAFDITTGALSRAWGFFDRRGRWPAPDELAAALDLVGTQFIELDCNSQSVRFGKPGLEINLGSIGKGYALDRCAERLRDAGISDFLLHGGQSSILASGTRRRRDDEPAGWEVTLRHPLRPAQSLGTLRLVETALGTSGSGNQFFYHRGRRWGHILDPRTGYPAEGILSVSVLAPTAALADALATALFVMGAGAARTYCQDHPDVGAVFVVPGTEHASVTVESMGSAVPAWHAVA